MERILSLTKGPQRTLFLTGILMNTKLYISDPQWYPLQTFLRKIIFFIENNLREIRSYPKGHQNQRGYKIVLFMEKVLANTLDNKKASKNTFLMNRFEETFQAMCWAFIVEIGSFSKIVLLTLCYRKCPYNYLLL